MMETDCIINKKYKIIKKIGAGSFGHVYLGKDLTTDTPVALKVEKKSKCAQLKNEKKIYKALQGGLGFGECKWFGHHTTHNVLVTELLGKCLESHFHRAKKKFDVVTTLLCGRQMIERIEFLHSKDIIHRDIKPENFVTGRDSNAGTIYIIDFGLSKKYQNHKTKKHIPYREGRSLVGTPRYASLNTHRGIEQSRRDDLESIGYVLCYFARGRLPWQGVEAKTKDEKIRKIYEKKAKVSARRLCSGIECLREFLEYARALRYADKPNYEYLKNLFTTALNTEYADENKLPVWMTWSESKRNETKLLRGTKCGKNSRGNISKNLSKRTIGPAETHHSEEHHSHHSIEC